VAGEWSFQPESGVLVLDNSRTLHSVALASLRAAVVFFFLIHPYSPELNPIADVFSVGSSSLRRWSSPDQFSARPMTTIDAMLLQITGNRCRGFVEVADRRYHLYIP